MSLKENRRKRCGPAKCNQMIFVFLLFCALSITGIFAYLSDGDYTQCIWHGRIQYRYD